MTYSLDFRRKVLKVREKEGLSTKEAAERFNIGVDSVMRWVKHIKPQEKRHKPALKINMEALAQDVQEHPDSYHYERAKRFCVSTTCIRKALRRLGMTYKKKSQASEGGCRKKIYVLPSD